MAKEWTAEEVLKMGSSYQAACVLLAAAELEVFSALRPGANSALGVARSTNSDPRAMAVLLDALVALGLLDKGGDVYTVPPGVTALLAEGGARNVLAMAQHQANCLRRWAELTRVVKTGEPVPRKPSIRGEAADYASFVEAMDNISGPVAAQLIGEIRLPKFTHVLDVGGATGTWTIALLNAYPEARATLFDLPKVIPQAKARLTSAGVAGRVNLVGGDFYADPLPRGADLALVSAIVHQNSREQNRKLFADVAAALNAGGHILIRDILMDEGRTAPLSGAMFAINMLTGTASGGTFTFEELREDLEAAGFGNAEVLRRDAWMNSFVVGMRR